MRRFGRTAARWTAVALAAWSAAAAAAEGPGQAAAIAAGKRIYEKGLLASGEALRAERDGMVMSGASAACIQCHRRSGMGGYEGGAVVPPVAGPMLFNAPPPSADSRRRRAPGVRLIDYHFRTRPAYTDAALARAIRDGVSPAGHRFDYLMPRYSLGDDDLAALAAYLKSLSAQPSPGVDRTTVHFATVVASAGPEQRETMLEVLDACFRERMPRSGSGARKWRLHVWDLKGPPEEWSSELQRRYREQPVFAMVSGLGQGGWGPVARFCEGAGVPCLFPNTDLPEYREGDFYSLHFFDGVALEASILARRLAERPAPQRAGRIVQVFRADDIGAAASRALRDRRPGPAAVDWPLDGSIESDWRLPALGEEDTLVLWLRPSDLERFVQRNPAPPAGEIYLSGTLAGLERIPLRGPWRAAARIAYPFDLPERRGMRMGFNLHPWLKKQGIAPRDERLQGSTLAACGLLADGMARIRDIYLRDYLIESIETAMGNSAASAPFPRFGLGPNQRFGSKGAYIVRLGGDGAGVVPESDWIVP